MSKAVCAVELWRGKRILSQLVDYRMLNQVLKMGCREATRHAGGMSGGRRGMVCGSGQLQFLPPNLGKRRKARKCSPDPVKRRKEPALQMGKESVPNLPALATDPSEEINQDCLRERERAGVLPKGSQCSPQTSS